MASQMAPFCLFSALLLTTGGNRGYKTLGTQEMQLFKWHFSQLSPTGPYQNYTALLVLGVDYTIPPTKTQTHTHTVTLEQFNSSAVYQNKWQDDRALFLDKYQITPLNSDSPCCLQVLIGWQRNHITCMTSGLVFRSHRRHQTHWRVGRMDHVLNTGYVRNTVIIIAKPPSVRGSQSLSAHDPKLTLENADDPTWRNYIPYII